MVSPIYFSALKNPHTSPSSLRRDCRREKIREIALSILTLGIYAACRYLTYKKIVPMVFMPSICRKAPSLPEELGAYQSIKIKTLDGVELDASSYEVDSLSKKWMVAFCPNGSPYEETADAQVEIARKVGVNLLLFNYRQVGKSGGTLTSSFKLALDGSAVVEYLKSKGIEEKDMLFSGHSMGGGAAAMLTKYYPGVGLVNNRSYSFISSAAPTILKPFVKLMSFEINALKPWTKMPSDRKLIVYHHRDRTIPYREAGLYYAFKEFLKRKHPGQCEKKHTSKNASGKMGLHSDQKPMRLKLKGGGVFSSEHSYHLEGKELEELVEKMKTIIHR